MEDVNLPIIGQLLSGTRPEGMSYEEFKIKRNAINHYLKKRSKGTLAYLPKEIGFETINGEKKKVIKNYGPYRKSNDRK